MIDDLRSYQTAETAWRYEAKMNNLKKDIADTEALLAAQKAALEELQRHPPLYHLFNWSA